MKNKLYFIMIIFMVLTFTSCTIQGENVNNPTVTTETKNISDNTTNEIPKSVDTIPVTRATVAKMISLAFNDKSTINATEIEINFEDVSLDEWYTPYINMAVLEGYMSGGDKFFKPDEPLTLEQAQILLDKLNPNNKTKIKMTEDIADKPISYALWSELYIKMLQETSSDKTLYDSYSISEESLIILNTPSNTINQTAWTMNTDKGVYSFTGLNMDSYIDCKVKTYTKDNEIIVFVNVEDSQPIITNAYLVESSESELKIFVGEAERTYKTADDAVIDTTIFTTPIVDIKVEQGKVLEIKAIKDVLNQKFIRADKNYIELSEAGIIDAYDDIKVYSNINNNIEWKSIKSIVSGTDIAQFLLKNGKVCAAIINKELVPEKIRVVIGTTGFEKLVHQNVKITATSDYTVSYGNEIKEYKKDDIFEVNNETFNDTDRIYIKPNSMEEKIEIQSITRNSGIAPQYRGIIEIAKQEDGYSIVNDILLEEYLYAVVPSEMPTSYGIEAAKVQAITARSYAYNQIFSNKYYRYGANVDDSIQCQVYNNTPENQNSIKAVNDTKSQILTYEGAVISANFFSTSSGITANSGEVWMNTTTKKFPADTPVYLTTVKQYQKNDYGDLSQEENASKFFKDTTIDSYDSDSSWFRWNVTMTMKELTSSINANIKQRYDANKSAIKTLTSDKIYRSRDIKTIGELKNIEVLKRGEGGNIMEMLFTGTEASVKVLTEYNIRSLLKPAKYIDGGKDVILNRKDGSKLANYSLMPSAFFTMNKNLDDNGNIVSITFYGGGNGHGAGMSQNGVKTMADEGYTCEEILSHYYKDTQIRTIQ